MKKLLLLLVVTLLLIIDYFLYVTGNYSLIYGVLGGWFVINAVVLITLFIYTIVVSFKMENRSFIATYVTVVLLFSVILYSLSDAARNHAKEAMHETVSEVLVSGLDNKMQFTNETENNFKKLSGSEYEFVFETFIPTKRRIDYLVHVNDGRKFRLIVIKRWDNSNQVYLGGAA